MADARTLVLARHGETEWNASGRAQGHTDVPLNASGREQAAALASALAGLGPMRLWSSDLARARQTAQAVAEETGLEVETDPRLREYDVGARAGLTLEEAAARFPAEHVAWLAGDRPVFAPGEESAEQVRERIVPALLACLDALAPGETGVAVLHGACLKVGLVALLGWPPEHAAALCGLDNAAYCVVVDEPGRAGLRLASYNVRAPGSARGPDFVADAPVG